MKILRNNSGLTMAEVMVVIGIIGIISAIAIPNFVGWLPKQRLNSATNDVLGVIQSARLRALKDHASVAIVFNAAADSYLVFLDNGAGANANNGVQDGDEPTIGGGVMPAGVHLDGTSFGGTLRFDSRSFPVGAVGDVNLSNNRGASKTITINVTGSSRSS
jgi:type IV fimbrial biogenesis protein FimT